MNQNNNVGIKRNPFWSVKYRHILLILACFTIVTALTIAGLFKNLDTFLLEFFKNVPRNPQSDLFIIIVTTLSDTINLMIAGFIILIIKKTRRFGLLILISLVISTIIVTYAKPLFSADQIPDTVVFKPLVKLPDKFTLEKDSFMPFSQNYSYPSNHLASISTFCFIIGGLLYSRSSISAKGFIIFFPMLIGITKLYLLQMYFSDVIGGWILGLLISSLLIKITKIDSIVKQ